MENPFLDDGPDIAGALADVAHIADLLQQAAREGRAVSYSELLMMLGFRFTRPKMRAPVSYTHLTLPTSDLV